MAYRSTARTEARKADQRRRILESARDLVATGGFANAQIAAVAKKADVATGTVYRYFPSKSDLFREVFREACGREVKILTELLEREGPLIERLRHGLEVFSRRAIRGRRLAYALIAEPIDLVVDEERIRFRRQYAGFFAKLLEEGIRTGELPEQDVQVSGAGVVGAMTESLVGPVMAEAHGKGEDEDRLVRSIVDFCMRAISSRGEEA